MKGNVTLNVALLLVPDWLVWVFQKLLISWYFHAISRVYRERSKNRINQWVVVLWVKMTCWCQEENGQTGLNLQKGNRTSNKHSLQPRYAGEHLCQFRTGNCRYKLHGHTKIGQQKIGKRLTGSISLDFCWDIQMVGSEFSINTMKAQIHPALCQLFRLVAVV